MSFFKTDISQKPYFTEISNSQGSWTVNDKFSFLPQKQKGDASSSPNGMKVSVISEDGLSEAKAVNDKQHQAWQDQPKQYSPYAYYVNFTNGFNPSAKEAVLSLIWIPAAAEGNGGWQFQLPDV